MCKYISFLLLISLLSCSNHRIQNPENGDEKAYETPFHDSMRVVDKTSVIEKEIHLTESAEDIAESSGYDLGYDQGFDDAGSLIYNDEEYPQYPDKSLQTIFIEAYKRGYEDGWIEWKNRNNELDY